MPRWPERTEEQKHEAHRAVQRRASARWRAANPDHYKTDLEREKGNARCKKRQERNRAIIREAKISPCVDCGMQYPPCAMDLDHVRGEKYKKVSNMLTAPVEDLLAEIAKCEIRCANCHRIRHAEVGDLVATSISQTL